MTAVWPREQYTLGGGPADIALIVLSPTKLPDPLPISRTKHGMPEDSEGLDAINLAARERAGDEAWFQESVVQPFISLITEDLGPEQAALALASQFAYVIEAKLPDPDDNGHVQAAWALAKCACELGASTVIDVFAARAHLGTDVAALDPERRFDLMHEVAMFFEEAADGKLYAWTLGLRKFGRPDLVMIDIPQELAAERAAVLRDVATMMADGGRIEPGDEIGGPDDSTIVVETLEAGQVEIEAVEGNAILLRC